MSHLHLESAAVVSQYYKNKAFTKIAKTLVVAKSAVKCSLKKTECTSKLRNPKD